jgi:hypothetical protein
MEHESEFPPRILREERRPGGEKDPNETTGQFVKNLPKFVEKNLRIFHQADFIRFSVP